MRRAALLLLLLPACSEDGGEPPPKEPPRPTLRWVSAQVFDLEVWLPEPWSRDARTYGKYQVHFSAPKDDGFRPQLQVLWRPSDASEKEWSDRMMGKFIESPQFEAFDRGPLTVAGMPAHYLVYGQTAKDPKSGATLHFRTIDFYFAGHDHEGMLRGVSTARTFREYRVLFTEIARRLGYRG